MHVQLRPEPQFRSQYAGPVWKPVHAATFLPVVLSVLGAVQVYPLLRLPGGKTIAAARAAAVEAALLANTDAGGSHALQSRQPFRVRISPHAVQPGTARWLLQS